MAASTWVMTVHPGLPHATVWLPQHASRVFVIPARTTAHDRSVTVLAVLVNRPALDANLAWAASGTAHVDVSKFGECAGGGEGDQALRQRTRARRSSADQRGHRDYTHSLQLEQKGSGPGARSSHAITLVGGTAYSFGGEFTPRVPVDSTMYAFDLKAQSWSALDATGEVPPPRVGVTMAAVGSTVFVFGGRDRDHKELNELYSFDTATSTWTLLSSGDIGPPHRSYHSMVADGEGSRVYVFGGCGNAGRLNDLWAYDAAAGRWEELPSPGAACPPRGGPGLAFAGGKVWVVHGFSGDAELDDVHSYDPATGEWAKVETTGDKPAPRSVLCAAGVGKHVVVFGGEVDPSDLGHLGAGKFSAEAFMLDTETGAWAKLDDASDHHPGPRGWCAFSAGALDGRKGMLVYGGNSPTNDRLDDMFLFTPLLA